MNQNPHVQLKLFNTLTRQKEDFHPLVDRQVNMYTCGPTVYNFAHIGNFRTYVFEDLLRRTLKFFGFKVKQVMNLTDVDDKTIRGALANNVSLDNFTKRYKDAFFEDLHTLRIEPVEHYPAATEYISEMIHMIEGLLKKGVAYRGGDGSIYFAIHKFPAYGALSHFCLHDLQAGASERVLADEYDKDHVSDFVLWKTYDEERDGHIYWESPFGKGRPGWHLECSVMAMHLLGETLDIHVGGVDNMFPHHENEIAQSEAYSGKSFVKLWMHSEHLLVDQKKMSKSLGNFFTLRDLLDKGYTGVCIRYCLLQTHYKTQLNFSFQGLESAKHSLERLNDFIQRLYRIDQVESGGGEVEPLCKKTLHDFTEALGDDLNISSALAAIFECIRHANTLCDENRISKSEAILLLDTFKTFDTVLGIFDFSKESQEIPQELQQAFEERQKARNEKDWKKADELRDFINQRGYLIEDTPQGARLKKNL